VKGFIRHVGLGLGWTFVLLGGLGCYRYRELIDPCWPDRYNYMARRELTAAFQPQVYNGHVLDQTMWNWHFEPGTDRLTAGGLNHLAYIARRRPHPDTLVFLQTAQDISYDPTAPDKLAEGRADLDAKRIAAVQKFLVAQTGGSCQFRVEVHDPAEPYLPAVAVYNAYNNMVTTRFRGGLQGSGSGAGAAGAPGAVQTSAPGGF
jgi:hypothetical protein